jgi:microcystin-dependent protein
MSDQFVAEIRIVGFNFPPKGWAFCDGQLLPLSQNTALFSLLGTNYGGNGKSNFALPNLQGSAPLQAGQGPGLSDRWEGETGGTTSVTLILSEIPVHSHGVQASNSPADENDPHNGYYANTTEWGNAYGSAVNAGGASMLAPAGGSLPHNNMQPYLTLNFIIALQGIYPPRT